ncbi:MAG: hypothetical protein JNM85_05630 [Chthonomonas sp.]|nr:hypothetical protein [Chthonomonas sp.]
MARLITGPTVIAAHGNQPKRIEEFFGAVNSGDGAVSVARMSSPQGWTEPGQTPEFDEYTVVLSGCLTVETRDGVHEVRAGQAIHTPAGEWVRYSTLNGATQYVAVCFPAFTPGSVHRDDD